MKKRKIIVVCMAITMLLAGRAQGMERKKELCGKVVEDGVEEDDKRTKEVGVQTEKVDIVKKDLPAGCSWARRGSQSGIVINRPEEFLYGTIEAEEVLKFLDENKQYFFEISWFGAGRPITKFVNGLFERGPRLKSLVVSEASFDWTKYDLSEVRDLVTLCLVNTPDLTTDVLSELLRNNPNLEVLILDSLNGSGEFKKEVHSPFVITKSYFYKLRNLKELLLNYVLLSTDILDYILEKNRGLKEITLCGDYYKPRKKKIWCGLREEPWKEDFCCGVPYEDIYKLKEKHKNCNIICSEDKLKIKKQ